jgi:hypothetical protein
MAKGGVELGKTFVKRATGIKEWLTPNFIIDHVP